MFHNICRTNSIEFSSYFRILTRRSSTKANEIVRNAAILFSAVPNAYPQVGKHIKYVDDRRIDLRQVPTDGGILVKNLVVSVDPYMVGRMRTSDKKSYIEPFELNQPLTNFAISKIIQSNNENFPVGRYVYGIGAFEEYSLVQRTKLESLRLLSKDQLSIGLPLTTWLGAAGMPGQTAYYGFYHIGKPRKGETIYISGAAGAVGQIVGQLAKREGLIVIGSAGSDEKVRWLKEELSFDHAFNYKTSNVRQELFKFDPLNIYFDNVGGEQLEAAISAAADHARFIECGMISQYNPQKAYAVRNLILIVRKRLKLEGFIIFDKKSDEQFLTEFYDRVPRWIADGQLKVKEDITDGLERGAQAIVGILQGDNFGKSVVKVSDDE